jgi:hypothetical protein
MSYLATGMKVMGKITFSEKEGAEGKGEEPPEVAPPAPEERTSVKAPEKSMSTGMIG